MLIFLVNLLLAIVAGAISLYVLRSLLDSMKDGWRVLIAVIIGLIVFLCNFAHYVVN